MEAFEFMMILREILLLLNVVESDMVAFYVEGCGASSAEYRVHLVSVWRVFCCARLAK